MLRRLRTVLLVVFFALAGAALGRVAAEVRRRQEAGEDPTDIDIRRLRIRPADVVPGLVAAVRVRDQPWSWLHIPSWLAAFAVNLAVAAVGGDLSRLREMAERAAFGLTGVELPRDDDEAFRYRTYDRHETGFATTAYAPESDPAATTNDVTDARPATGEDPDSNTWTVPGGEPRRTEPEPPSGGFTPFRD